MDVLDDLLSGTRARGGVFNLTILDQPWGLDVVDRAPLALACVAAWPACGPGRAGGQGSFGEKHELSVTCAGRGRP